MPNKIIVRSERCADGMWRVTIDGRLSIGRYTTKSSGETAAIMTAARCGGVYIPTKELKRWSKKIQDEKL